MHFLLAEAAVDHVKAVAWISLLVGLAWLVLALFWFAATRQCADLLRDVLKEIRALRRQAGEEPRYPELPPPAGSVGMEDDDTAIRFLENRETSTEPEARPVGGAIRARMQGGKQRQT